MSYEIADGYKVRDQYGLYFMTFAVVGWIDLFSRKVYRDLFIKNMVYCREQKGLSVGAYVIMTNHVHVIWQSKEGKLSDTLRDFKSYCTKEFIKTIETENESRESWLLHMFKYYAKFNNQNKDYKIWVSGSHPEEITSEEFMRVKLKYIHENPVRAGWVKQPEEYIYSSAANYAGGKGICEVDFLF